MSQEEVLNILKRAGKPLSSKQIAKKLRLSISSVSNSIRKLRKQNLIKREYGFKNNNRYGVFYILRSH